MTPQTMAGTTFGVGILSSIIGGFGKYSQGQEERKAYDYNADITLENMRDRMVQNQAEYTKLIGKQASGYGAAGVDIASGSPLLIMAATAAKGGEQGKMIEQQGTEEAALQRYYGKVAAFSGTMGGIGSFLTGIGTAAGGYYGATAKLPKPTPPPSGGPDATTDPDWQD